jgi:Cft2 family RNA processing exonuclease
MFHFRRSARWVGPKLPAFNPDVLVLESTYGGRLHANRAVQERRMVEVVREVTAGGGKVLMPAFALGRAQEILLIMSEFQRRGELPAVPVWADGMVRAVCQVYPVFKRCCPCSCRSRARVLSAAVSSRCRIKSSATHSPGRLARR